MIAGIFDYLKGLYVSPFINTKKIEKLKRLMAWMENKIATNKQRMENHFKKLRIKRIFKTSFDWP